MTRHPSISEDDCPVRLYAEAVVSGEEIAGPHVRAACQRHLDDLENGHERGLWFDYEACQRVLSFFPDVLRLNGGQFEGIPFDLHPSQAFIVGSLFGWKIASGARRFRTSYIEMGKGNGKSPLAGGIGLYMMTADHEPGAEIYAAATKTEQARILFKDAVKMVQQSPALSARLELSGNNPVHTISRLKDGSFFKPISKESGKTGSGPRPHCGLIDELHEHPNRDITEMIERGFKFRQNPLLFQITNSGSDRNSYCFEQHELAVKAAHRSHEPAELASLDRLFSYVCALDEGDDPLAVDFDEDGKPIHPVDVWKKANPLLGTILTEEYLAGVAADARTAKGKANGIKRLHFCQWTDAESAWLDRTIWEAAEDSSLTEEEFYDLDVEAVVGLDLGAKQDLTGLAKVFPDGKTEDGKPKFALIVTGYTPADTLRERAKRDSARYVEWVDEGYLNTTPGKVTQYEWVVKDLVDFQEKIAIRAIAYDKWMFSKFEDALDEFQVEFNTVEHPQGPKRRKDTPLCMNDSVEMFEELLLEKRLRIAVNPALRSAISSAVVVETATGQRFLDKKKSTARIDLAVAAVMAVGAASEAHLNAPSSKGTPRARLA